MLFDDALYTLDEVHGGNRAFIDGMAYVLDSVSGYISDAQEELEHELGYSKQEAAKVAHVVQKVIEFELEGDTYEMLANLAEEEVAG